MIVWALVREWAAWHFTLLRFVSCWILVWPHFTSLLSFSSFPSLDCEILPIMWRLWLWFVCVWGGQEWCDRVKLCGLTSGALAWKKKCPWNHETMRVITYLGVAEGPLMEVLDLEHPSSIRNIKELPFKTGELWTTLGIQRKRPQYKCGVPRKDKHGALLSAKIEVAVKKGHENNARMKKWPICSIPSHLKTTVKLTRWPQIFFWSMLLLLLSLCPQSASSQVQDASETIYGSTL